MALASAGVFVAGVLLGAAAVAAAFAAGLYLGARRPPPARLPLDARCFKSSAP
jgi:hypothetical protein